MTVERYQGKFCKAVSPKARPFRILIDPAWLSQQPRRSFFLLDVVRLEDSVSRQFKASKKLIQTLLGSKPDFWLTAFLALQISIFIAILVL